ncbi:MAG: leucine-rich repeat domain-containing protein, partial [Clostridia bacterium]|nr:leucine-rich repeat domain-containing protein [Clostridia bacterium]
MKRTIQKLISFLLAVVTIIATAPLSGLVRLDFPSFKFWASAEENEEHNEIDYSYLTPNQYMTKILLNYNYSGGASPVDMNDDTVPQAQLKYWLDTSKASTARLLRNEINSNSGFIDSVVAWEVLTFDPSDEYENILNEEDYYVTILLSILDVQLNDSEFLDAWNCSTNKTILSLSKSTTKFMKETLSIDVEDLQNINVEDLSEDEFNSLMSSVGKTIEAKNLYTQLGENVKLINDISKTCTSVYDIIKTVSTYSQIADLNSAVESVLKTIYDNCPDSTPMKNAAKKVYNICSKQMTQAMFAYLETQDAIINTAFKYCVGKVWDYAIEGALGSLGTGFKLGQAIGTAISNFCFSTEAIIEQYYVLDAVVKFEDIMVATVNSLAESYKEDESSENADNFMKSVELLFSVYDLGCDYTLAFATTARSNGLYNTIKSWFGKSETLESYKEATSSIKTTMGLIKNTLTNLEGYRWYYEYDAPSGYVAYFEPPILTPAYSKTEEIVNIEPIIMPEIESGAILTYKQKQDKTIVITGCNSSAVGQINIPKEIGGFPVIEISSFSFKNCTGITYISTDSALKTIESSAFYNCKNLSEINLNSGLEAIYERAFYGTAIEEVTIPNTVT